LPSPQFGHLEKNPRVIAWRISAVLVPWAGGLLS
jgi:hypothetical protein